ncbi:MAG: sugar isomerase domain-containing protein [Mycobacteriales bacterium]
MTDQPGEAGPSLGVSSYLRAIEGVLSRIEATQLGAIDAAARLCAGAIAADGLVHAFGSGHSRMIVEELWPRYGSFPGFHPIVESSLTSYHSVAGANGMRQAMFLENVPGLGAQIVANFRVGPPDVLIAISSGGTGVVTVEVAEAMAAQGVRVVALTALEHSRASTPRAPSGRRLFEIADVTLDTCTPIGDSAVRLAGSPIPVGPTSTVAGAVLANAVKVRTAELLLGVGVVPLTLPSGAQVGETARLEAFELSFREHARRVSRLYRP